MGLKCHADIIDWMWVMRFWGLTCDFWAKNEEKSCKCLKIGMFASHSLLPVGKKARGRRPGAESPYFLLALFQGPKRPLLLPGWRPWRQLRKTWLLTTWAGGGGVQLLGGEYAGWTFGILVF
jgi:hypothetical protein